MKVELPFTKTNQALVGGGRVEIHISFLHLPRRYSTVLLLIGSINSTGNTCLKGSFISHVLTL